MAKTLTWKETKSLLGNSGPLKLFKNWFEDQIFTKAKVNPNHFYGESSKPIAGVGIGKAHGLYITDKGSSTPIQYNKGLAQFKKLTALKTYKSYGYIDLKYPIVVTMDKSKTGKQPLVLSVWDANVWNNPGKPQSLFTFIYEPTGLAIRDPSKKTTDTSGKTNNKGKAWGKFVKPANAPWTVIQETISLKMFEHLIGVKGGISGVKKGKDGFGDQPPGHKQFLKDGFCNKVIEPMWPHIHHPDNYKTKPNDDGTLEPQTSGSKTEWLGHFKRQYDWIAGNTHFPAATFDVFSYTEFMTFISDLIVAGDWPVFGNISKKDTWNPADIWIVKQGSDYTKLKAALATAPTILKVNAALKNAFNNKIVCGISLKQSHPTGIKFELVNLKLVKQFSDPSSTPFVTFDSFNFDIPFDGKKFTKKTNDIIFSTSKGPVGKLRIGSNSSTPGNITQDMHGVGDFRAAFGKMPKDLGWMLLQQNFKGALTKADITGFPAFNHPSGTTGGIIDKTYIHGKSAHIKSKIKLPRGKLKENEEYWQTRVDYITKNGGRVWNSIGSGQGQINSLISNLKKLERNGDPRAKPPNNVITTETNASLQFVELLYLYCVLYHTSSKLNPPTGPGNVQFSGSDQKKFDWIMGKFFYFSQKKGSAFGSNFGPFGKLY